MTQALRGCGPDKEAMADEGTTGTAPESAPVDAGTPVEQEATSGLLDTPLEGDQTTDEAPAEAVVDDSEEIDYEGKKFKAPPGIKDALLRHADYTRKTQEVADARRQVEQQYAEFQQRAQLQQTLIVDVAKAYSLAERVQQFKAIDWNALSDADPVQAQKLERQMRNLEAEQRQVEQGIAQKQQAMTFSAQQETAKRIEEGQRELQREIKDWSPELQTKLAETAKSYGFKPEELAQVSDPRTVRMLNDARLYRELVAQRTTKPAAAPQTPVTQIKPRASTAITDMDRLSTDQWLVERNKQLAAKRKQR